MNEPVVAGGAGQDPVAGSRSFGGRDGFSLVEVLLALAVVSTGILALLQLMGPALESLSVTHRVSVADRIPATVALAAREHPWSVLLAEDAVVVFFCVLQDERGDGSGPSDRLLTHGDLAKALEEGVPFGNRVFELRARPMGSGDSVDRFVKVVEVRPLPPLGPDFGLNIVFSDRFGQEPPAFVFPIRVPRQ